MKKQPVDWGRVIGRLLQSGIGGFEGGFCVDENGHLVEDYLETENADAAAYFEQLAREDALAQEDDGEEFAVLEQTPME